MKTFDPESLGSDSAVSPFCKSEVRYLDRSHELESVQIVTQAIEQALTAAEERRHEINLHLVHEAGREIS